MASSSAPTPAPDALPAAGPLDIPVSMRWLDLDAYGHVNNAAMLGLLEEARIAAFWQAPAEQIELGAPAPRAELPVGGVGAPISSVLASQRIEYTRQLGYRRDGVVVRLWIPRIGGASLTVDYLVLTRDDPEGEQPFARARTVIVLVDAGSGRPVRIDDASRERLARFSGEPLVFRD